MIFLLIFILGDLGLWLLFRLEILEMEISFGSELENIVGGVCLRRLLLDKHFWCVIIIEQRVNCSLRNILILLIGIILIIITSYVHICHLFIFFLILIYFLIIILECCLLQAFEINSWVALFNTVKHMHRANLLFPKLFLLFLTDFILLINFHFILF